MRAQVKKWGNSASVRIPASVMEAASLSIDQPVDVREENGRVVIEPVKAPKYNLDEMIAADLDAPWESCYRLVAEERRPVFGDTAVPTVDGGVFSYEFGIFPLSPDGTTVSQCVAIEDYGELNERLFELQDKTQPWQRRSRTPREPGGER